MSLAFQNTDSVKQAMLEELNNLLSADKVVRDTAEQRMKQLEYTDVYGVYLAELIMNQSFELPLRQCAGIMLTRYVTNHWSDADDEESMQQRSGIANEQAKKVIRNILPNGLYDSNSKIRASVAHTISTIAATDFPNAWPELFDIIIKCLGGNEDSIHGAMKILQDFSYDEKQIKEIGPIIVREVYRIFESDQSYSIKTRTSAICLLKPLLCAISAYINDKQEQASMMDSILKMFMDKIVAYLAMNSGAASNFAMRMEIVKTLTFLVSEMPKFISPHMDRILPSIWQLLTQVADTYVKVVVNSTEPSSFPKAEDEDDDEIMNLSTMIIQIFEFIQCVIGNMRFRAAIKRVLTDLIYIMILYIQITEELLEEWQDDLEKFVEDGDEEGGELSIRLSGMDVISTLNDELNDGMLASLQEALARHMSVAQAERAAGNRHWWKIQEACLTAVHTCREAVIEFEDKFDLLNYLTVAREMLHHQEFPHLVGRALWTLSTYCNSNIFNLQMMAEILDVTLESLTPDKSLVLRLSAVRAIECFLQTCETETEKRMVIQSKLYGMVDGIFTLIGESKNYVLTLVLNTISAMIAFDPPFAIQVSHRLHPLIIAVFVKHPEDPFIQDVVQDMIKAVCQNPVGREALQERFLPTILSILQPSGDAAHTLRPNALDALTTMIKYSDAPLSNPLLETFPAVVQCLLSTEDSAVMISGGECLRAFIFVSPNQICSYKNGEGVDYIMRVATTILNPMNNERSAGLVGGLVITIISKIGNMLGDKIELLLKAVISKMQLISSLNVIMSLVVIFAHLILTQMDAILNFLSTVPGPTGEPAMHYVLSVWLSKQSSFYGTYETKVTTMALCKLLDYGITSQDTRVTSVMFKELVIAETPHVRTRSQAAATQQMVEIPALVKIFKLLINELASLKESSMFAADCETDDDEAAAGEKTQASPPKTPRYVSDLIYDDPEEIDEDDQLTQELLRDPLFQVSMEETLTKFFQNFSTNEHFGEFFQHLNEAEKNVLKNLGRNAVQ